MNSPAHCPASYCADRPKLTISIWVNQEEFFWPLLVCNNSCMKRSSSFFLLGCLFALLAIGSIQRASATNPNKIISACFDKKSRVLRYSERGKCRKGEQLLSWNVTGPRGESGSPGLQGLQGLQGPRGQAGDSSATSAQGQIGPAGPAGAIGPMGATGPTGLTGLTGPAGPTGVTGPTGPAGPSGSFILKDGNGNSLGTILNGQSDCWNVWSGQEFHSYDLTTGAPCDPVPSTRITYWSSTNCTGLSYIKQTIPVVAPNIFGYTLPTVKEKSAASGTDRYSRMAFGPAEIASIYSNRNSTTGICTNERTWGALNGTDPTVNPITSRQILPVATLPLSIQPS